MLKINNNHWIDRRAYLAAGITVVLWASAFPGIRVALQSYSPTYIAVIRYIIPIFMAIEAIPFLGERLRVWGWAGIALSSAAIVLITLSQNTGFHIDLWAVLILTAAIAQSLYSVGQKPLPTRYTAFECTAFCIWAGTIFLLIFSPGLVEDIRIAPLPVTLSAIYLGVFPGALGYVSWAYALSGLPASTAARFLYLVPIVAIGIAWVWLGEVPTLLALFGGFFVLAGVILVNTRGRRMMH